MVYTGEPSLLAGFDRRTGRRCRLSPPGGRSRATRDL